MLSALQSVSYIVGPGLRRKGYPVLQPALVRTFARGKSRDPRYRVIDNTEKHKEKMKAENRTWTRPEENIYKPPAFSVFNFVQNTAKSVASRVSNTFFPDEVTRAKNEVKKEINAQIDATFKGGGLLGGIMKQIIKTVLVQVTCNLVKQQTKITYDTKHVLNRDPTTKRLLGLPLNLSDPDLSELPEPSSFSYYCLGKIMGMRQGDKNGRQQSITMQVTGSRNTGVVRALMDNVGGEWVIQQVAVTVDNTNQTYEAEMTAKPDKDHSTDV